MSPVWCTFLSALIIGGLGEQTSASARLMRAVKPPILVSISADPPVFACDSTISGSDLGGVGGLRCALLVVCGGLSFTLVETCFYRLSKGCST